MQTLASQFQGILTQFLDANPQYAADPGGVLEKYVLDTLHTCMAAYAQGQTQVPPVTPTLDLVAVEKRSRSGLIPGLLSLDHDGRLKAGATADATGTTLIALLSSFQKRALDYLTFLASADGAQALGLVATDPMARGALGEYFVQAGRNDFMASTADPAGMKWFSILEGFEPWPDGVTLGPELLLLNADGSPYPV